MSPRIEQPLRIGDDSVKFLSTANGATVLRRTYKNLCLRKMFDSLGSPILYAYITASAWSKHADSHAKSHMLLLLKPLHHNPFYFIASVVSF